MAKAVVEERPQQWVRCDTCGRTVQGYTTYPGWSLQTIEGTLVGNWRDEAPPVGRIAPDGSPAKVQRFRPNDLAELECGHDAYGNLVLVDHPRVPLTCFTCGAHITGMMLNPVQGAFVVPCGDRLTQGQWETLSEEMSDG